MAGHGRAISAPLDLQSFVRSVQLPANAQRVPRKAFAPPQLPAGETDELNEYGVSSIRDKKNHLWMIPI